MRLVCRKSQRHTQRVLLFYAPCSTRFIFRLLGSYRSGNRLGARYIVPLALTSSSAGVWEQPQGKPLVPQAPNLGQEEEPKGNEGARVDDFCAVVGLSARNGFENVVADVAQREPLGQPRAPLFGSSPRGRGFARDARTVAPPLGHLGARGRPHRASADSVERPDIPALRARRGAEERRVGKA